MTDANYSRTIVGQGYNVTINYTVWNLGDFTQEFDIILYGNQTTLQTTPALLSPNTQISISFVWNTSNTAKGNYSLNTCTHLIGWVFVTIPGDVDGDRDVDIYDIVSMAGSYGTNEGEPDYEVNYDIEGDGDIDIFDIVSAAGNYGESW